MYKNTVLNQEVIRKEAGRQLEELQSMGFGPSSLGTEFSLEEFAETFSKRFRWAAWRSGKSKGPATFVVAAVGTYDGRHVGFCFHFTTLMAGEAIRLTSIEVEDRSSQVTIMMDFQLVVNLRYCMQRLAEVSKEHDKKVTVIILPEMTRPFLRPQSGGRDSEK